MSDSQQSETRLRSEGADLPMRTEENAEENDDDPKSELIRYEPPLCQEH
jgi:hypothetical protein